jgi:hypothetical protein
MMPDKTPAMNLRPMCAPCSSMDRYMDSEWGATMVAYDGGSGGGPSQPSHESHWLPGAFRSLVRRRHEAASGLQA